MSTLTSVLAMDGENYLHPEGPQLNSSMFSVGASNMEASHVSALKLLILELLKFAGIAFMSGALVKIDCFL